MDSSSTVATPLLAGFALTMATIVITNADKFRWADWVLAHLTIAVVSLVMCVQAAQWTRTFRVRPWEVAEWWPEMDSSKQAILIDELVNHDERRQLWGGIQTWTYRIGVVFLLAGVAAALVPPTRAGDISLARWIAIGVAGLAFVAEVAWVLVSNKLVSPPKKVAATDSHAGDDGDEVAGSE